MTPTALQSEHLEDLTAHAWCNALLSDPTITHISTRQVPNKQEGISNTFFTRTLFTPTSIRAFLSLYRPGFGKQRDPHGDNIFTDGAPLHYLESSTDAEAARQLAKRDIAHDPAAADAPETLVIVSIGDDVDGGMRRLHGGVTATLLDQAMGTLLTYVYTKSSATSELSVRYLKAVSTPCVLLVRAKLKREKGRWIEAVAWVEDGMGTVFAEGQASFVLTKAAAVAKM